jgi:hypothetical protein
MVVVATLGAHTGRPARVDGYAAGSGDLGATARQAGVHGSLGAPIIMNSTTNSGRPGVSRLESDQTFLATIGASGWPPTWLASIRAR